MDFIQELHLNTWLEFGIGLCLLLIGIIVTLKKKVKTFTLSRQISNDWSIHSQVHERLTELRVMSDCARVHLVQFHNGEYFMDGVSLTRLSCTHESLTKGVSSVASLLTNVIISLHAPLIENLVNENSQLHIVKDEKDGYYKNVLESANVICYMVLPIKYKNMISGYIAVQWCSTHKINKVINNKEEYGTILTNTRNQIQIHLNEQLRSSK